MRLSVSRPYWSAPNQCSADGGDNAFDRSCSYGSNGATSGANTVNARNTAAIARPNRAPVPRSARRITPGGDAMVALMPG